MNIKRMFVVAILLIIPELTLSQQGSIQKLQILNVPDPVIEQLIAEHNFEQAEAILVHELKNSPHDARRLLMLAQLYFDEHRYHEAASILTDVNQVAGPTADGETLEGLIDVVRGNLSAAEARFRKALEIDPKSGPAHYYLARDLYTQQSMLKAIPQFKNAIALDPSFIRAFDGLGLAYQAIGAKADATYWFQQGMKEDKKNPLQQSEWLPLDFATFLLPYGASDYIGQLLNLARSRNPSNPKVYYELGAYYYQLGRYCDAIIALKRVFQIDPQNARAHYLCGRSYHALHEEGLAKKEFARFREMSKNASLH